VALQIASAREQRSIVNMIGVLIRDHCARNGIAIPERNGRSDGNGESAKCG
jgi:hypothetical protein